MNQPIGMWIERKGIGFVLVPRPDQRKRILSAIARRNRRAIFLGLKAQGLPAEDLGRISKDVFESSWEAEKEKIAEVKGWTNWESLTATKRGIIRASQEKPEARE